MSTRSIHGRPGSATYPAALVVAALAAALLVTPARAADPADGTAEGWKKVFAFAHCAVNVFRAVTPADWSIAFIDCSRLYLEEPPVPGGGQP